LFIQKQKNTILSSLTHLQVIQNRHDFLVQICRCHPLQKQYRNNNFALLYPAVFGRQSIWTSED